jgi:predicted regulator of Ras-like GTPase activity (Roadblock/LC7/MglB family)
MFPPMDPDGALAELLEVSDDIEAVVVFERGGEPVAATVSEEDAAELAALGDAMLAYAGTMRATREAVRVEGVTHQGGVFVVRDGERAVLAITSPGALVGLVQHDLRVLLRKLSRRRKRVKASAAT